MPRIFLRCLRVAAGKAPTMARADVLLDLVRAGARGDQALFRKALEVLVVEERAKQHHVLADRLAANLAPLGRSANGRPLIANRNGPALEPYVEIEPQRRIDDLLLPAVACSACRELVEEQARSELLRSYNIEPRHRVLLAGPPGNGKTSLAEALATELAVPLIVVRYESVITSFLGETAVRLSRLFEQVRTRRCLLFFDEFDVIAKERGDVHETGEIKRVVSSLLLQADALPTHVVIVTATNHPELLDRAVWRRFQLRLELPPPSRELREEWFRRLEKRMGLDLGRDAASMAKRLDGLSFSELEQFGLDVQRKYVLALPQGDVRSIVRNTLRQWEARFSVEGTPAKGRGRRKRGTDAKTTTADSTDTR